MFFLRVKLAPLVFLGFNLFVSSAIAAGMVPETSLLLINEVDRGGEITIKNTDTHPSLLYTNVVDLPDDKEGHLIVTQPVTRVEPGQTQLLRFIFQTAAPLKVEHLKRVTFEGIPPKLNDNKIREVDINIRQDIPVLIHPASLPIVKDAWTLLKWHVSGNTLTVDNDSPYVVRLSPMVNMLPSKNAVKLAKTYILPGESLSAKSSHEIGADSQVKFYPASRYGVEVPSYTAAISDAINKKP